MASKETGDVDEKDDEVDNTMKDSVNSSSFPNCAKTVKGPSECLKGKQVDDFNIKWEKKTYERDYCVVPDWPSEFECLFVWHLQDERGIRPENAIRRSLTKLEDLNSHNESFTLKGYMALLKLVVEFYITNQDKESWDKMEELEALLNKAKEEAKREENHPYLKIRRGLDHIVYATKAYMMMLHGRQNDARLILESITPVNLFNNDELVFLNLKKARYFYSFGYKTGKSIAIEFCNKALDLDPENVDALFFKAKVLRALRRDVMFSSEVPEEEISLLEKACKNGGDSHKKVYLAQAYRDCADALFKRVKKLQSSALTLYKEALEETPESDKVLRRVGYGIMNLPRSVIGSEGYKLSLDCLNRSLEKSESQMTLNVLGTYYSRHENDQVKALEYFERSIQQFQSDVGLCDKVKIKFKMDPCNYDPIPDLMSGLELDLKKSKFVQIMAQIGSYFLFIKGDLVKSLEAFSQVVNDEESLNHLKVFKVFFLQMYDPINLPEYIVNECKLFMVMNLNALSDENKSNYSANLELVQELHSKIIELEPDLAEIEARPDLVRDLLKLSDSNLKNEKKNQNSYLRKNNRNQRDNYNRNFRSQPNMNQETGTEQCVFVGNSSQPTQRERINRTFGQGNSYYQQQERGNFSHTAGTRGGGFNDYHQNDRYLRYNQQNRGGSKIRRDQSEQNLENWRLK